VLTIGSAQSSGAAAQPKIESRKAAALTVDGLKFRDLNRNGKLDKYEDWRLPVDQRVADLVSKMTLEEKAGLMIHTSLSGFTGPNGEVLGLPVSPAGGGGRGGAPVAPANRAIQGAPNMNNVEPMDSASPNELIAARNIKWILVRPNAGEAPEITARFHNSLQEMAEETRLGIPLVFSSDPRHTAGRGGTAAPVISQWPDQIGLGAIPDPEATREFGQIAGQELRALGIACTLSPMADTATEPRWNRISGTFGDDAEWNAKLVKAYVEGFQGKQLGPESVMTVVKHFPGDGPTKDGLDPHNSYGKWTIYPGNNFEYHLIPFKAAFEAGTGGIMGGYFIPVGKDTMAINFSKAMITGLLREKMGFQGLVVTDWLRNMPWGVEKLSEKDRQKLIVLAGVDQIGGDNDPKYILANFKDGSIPMAVIDAAARRILKPMFQMGMFEDPYVDPQRAKTLVASKAFVDAGYLAQVKSTVLLKNSNNLLPLAEKKKIYVENLSREAAGQYGTPVDDPKSADAAIIRVGSPAIVYPYGGAFAGGRAGSAPAAETLHVQGTTLAYTGSASENDLKAIQKLAASGTPTIVVVTLSRPAILTEFIDNVAAVLGTFGANDAAVIDLVFGKHSPTGKLSFDLPRDMPSVMAQAADVPHDLYDPLFQFGFGLTYGHGTTAPSPR
jgi:beta-glucosidase